MTLELSADEAAFLLAQLRRHLDELDHELVRTDKHELKAELARDVQRLHDLARRLERLIEAADAAA